MGIKHKAGFAKFPCADGMRGTAARPSASLWGPGCPHPPSHKAARHESPASLCSSFPPYSPPVPRGLCWPFTERTRGFRATVATAPAPARPLPGDVPLSHGRSTALGWQMWVLIWALRPALPNALNTHVLLLCPRSYRRAFSTTPFSEREPHVRPLRGAGSRCPAQPIKHPSFYCSCPSA